MTDDAVLILSELLSNSCRHARPLGADDEPDRPDYSGYSEYGGAADAARARPRVYGQREYGERAGHPGAPGGPAAAGRLGTGEAGGLCAGGIRASWYIGEDGLLVLEVTDGGGPTRPRPASPSLTAHGGRGLGIVESLALSWGVRDAPGEVTVWVLIPVRGRHARRDESAGTGIGLPMGVPLDLPLDLAESLDDMA
ncbi:ATP-binding protein [Streptomyces sp. NBC_01190]|uniref:ATP-binding protein n=1 Tax=Streptomyces sp. NBC_01190 TaxID=2903767 RepID=UPI00386BA268|nr:ATP-binding protein [Streptomyces sp. NBC_01190]